jgi:hypothetical protein
MRCARFELIRFHGDPLHSARAPACLRPLTTKHGQPLAVDYNPLLREFSEALLVSISDDQRQPVPKANWRAASHHGFPSDAFAHRGVRTVVETAQYKTIGSGHCRGAATDDV